MKPVSFSSIRDWNRCRRKSYYKRVLKLRKKVKPVSLKKGSWVHGLLEVYNVGNPWESKLKEYLKEYNQLMIEEREYYGDLPKECSRIMKGYIKFDKENPKPLKTVKAELAFGGDGEPQVEIIPGVWVKGRIDRIAKGNGGIWIQEYKTTKREIPTEGYRVFDLQTALYVRVAQKLGYGPILGIVFDYLLTKPPTVPEVTKAGELSKRKVFTDVETLMGVIKHYHLDPNDYKEQLEQAKMNRFYYRRFLPKPESIIDNLLEEVRIVAKEMQYLENYPHRNLTRECERDCEYYPLCTAELMGLDTKFMLEKEYTTEPEGGEEDETEQGEGEEGGE